MNKLPKDVLLWIVRYAFLIGLMIGALCMLMSFSLDDSSRWGALLINLAGDFFMVGLTISVIDRLIKRSERQKFGGVPDTAKKAINNEIWTLIGVSSYNIKDAQSKTIQQIIDAGLVDEAYKDDNLVKKMRIMNLAELQVIDEKKLTLGMFAEMLRFIRQTLGDLDGLIARYSAVLDTEDIAKAIALRDKVESLGSSQNMITITIPFFGQQTPKKLLDARQRSAFMSAVSDLRNLTDMLL